MFVHGDFAFIPGKLILWEEFESVRVTTEAYTVVHDIRIIRVQYHFVLPETSIWKWLIQSGFIRLAVIPFFPAKYQTSLHHFLHSHVTFIHSTLVSLWQVATLPVYHCIHSTLHVLRNWLVLRLVTHGPRLQINMTQPLVGPSKLEEASSFSP